MRLALEHSFDIACGRLGSYQVLPGYLKGADVAVIAPSPTAKTACSVIRYRREEVVAVLDGTLAGQDVSESLGVGAGLQMVSSLDEAPDANCLLIGIAPPGGQIPVLEAERGPERSGGKHHFAWSRFGRFQGDTSIQAVPE